MTVSPAPSANSSRRFPWALVICTLPVLAALLALGNWQVQRLAWKEGLLATIDARVNSDPVSIELVAERIVAGDDIRYQPVAVTGSFDHDRERHFFATHKGASGYYVYTPLRMADGRFVLINRGFVPFDLKEPETRVEGQVEGPLSVTGLARERLDAKPSFIVPENDPDANIFYWKDWQAMIDSTGLEDAQGLPFFIDADETPNPGGWPVGGVTRIDLPNDHLQYAITWYGLALTLVVVTGVFVWRRWKRVSG